MELPGSREGHSWGGGGGGDGAAAAGTSGDGALSKLLGVDVWILLLELGGIEGGRKKLALEHLKSTLDL